MKIALFQELAFSKNGAFGSMRFAKYQRGGVMAKMKMVRKGKAKGKKVDDFSLQDRGQSKAMDIDVKDKALYKMANKTRRAR